MISALSVEIRPSTTDTKREEGRWHEEEFF